MGNVWVAMSWSVAVLPAWLILGLVQPRLVASGPAVELLAFAGLWYLCGGILSQLTRMALGLLGMPISGLGDPAVEIAMAERLMASGRISVAEGQLRIAACRLALGQAEASLTACRTAEAAGAGSSHREQLRFLTGRSLEALGQRSEAADIYAGLGRDAAVSPLFRAAARLRLLGVSDNAGDRLVDDLRELSAAPGCPPCGRVVPDAGWSRAERDFLQEMYTEAQHAAETAGRPLTPEQSAAVRAWLDGSG